MSPIDAAAMLEDVPDRAAIFDQAVTIVCEFTRGRSRPVDFWPQCCAGLAVLSGWLDDATDLPSLLEAVEHGRTLLSSGVVSHEDVNAELVKIIHAIGDDARKARQ